MKHAVWKSIAGHAIITGFFLLISYLFSWSPPPAKIKVTIQEVPKIQAETLQEKPSIQLSQTPPPAPPKVVKKVFGISRKTLQSDAPGAVEIKAGNTIAKEIDQEKLNPEDEDSLPIPTEEYLVTQMPRLRSALKIPYPADARKNNISGPVVMDILVDEQGKVRLAELVSGPGSGLNEAAMEAIKLAEFSPAMIEQKPVAVRIRYVYRFTLNY
jgi:protein TonB